jgi:hypothetical protein
MDEVGLIDFGPQHQNQTGLLLQFDEEGECNHVFVTSAPHSSKFSPIVTSPIDALNRYEISIRRCTAILAKLT